jgi:predicted RNase H-like nuclease (RuvC/YqgF family)
MNPDGNPAPLAQARRRDSLDKRERVLTALAAFEHEGQKITHTALARTAGVSTWLTYTPGLREHIEAARRRQQPPPLPAPEHGADRAPAVVLRAELELACQEIHELRQAKDRLQQALRYQLGRQLDDLTTPDLSARVEELTHRNQELLDQLQQAAAENTALQAQVTRLEDDLAAARTSLRRMIREENRN